MSQLDQEPSNLLAAAKLGMKLEPRKARGIAPRHGFVIVTESKPPMSEAAVCALLNASLALEGTPIRIIEAKPEMR